MFKCKYFFCNLYYSVYVLLQVKYTTNPAVMAKVISTCLREERRILASACMQEQVCHMLSSRGSPSGSLTAAASGKSGLLPGRQYCIMHTPTFPVTLPYS